MNSDETANWRITSSPDFHNFKSGFLELQIRIRTWINFVPNGFCILRTNTTGPDLFVTYEIY